MINWFAENAREEKQEENGEEIKVTRELTDDAIVYLQENYIVTDGIFEERNITPDWIEYCQQALEFKIPDYAQAGSTGAIA